MAPYIEAIDSQHSSFFMVRANSFHDLTTFVMEDVCEFQS